MAIPNRPLELDIETRKLTLGEAAIFDPEEAEENPAGWINKVRKFMIARSVSWTAEEINAIEVDEMTEVGRQVAEAYKRAAVPLASLPRSRTTRGARPTRSRPGSTNSPTPNSSTSHPERSEAG